MFYFLQFKPNKQEPWRMYHEEQLQDPSKLPGPPAFQTVLMVDEDPEAVQENELNPLEHVKYFGPMYLDFDDADNLDRVLDDVRLVLEYLVEKLNIPEEFISCWLSGGKGVHITIPAEIFGIKSATKALPYIYREIMLTIKAGAGLEKQSTVDESVYSAGRGRMWRCEGVARPGKGTFKVATSISELQGMDAEMYEVLVSNARPPLAIRKPAKTLVVMQCVEMMKKAKVTANRKIKAMLAQCTVPKDVLRQWEGIPGCVEKLITEGDCEGSNWNQAALQLASYIAARYERSEEKEFMEQLVYPFAKNVQSSSRPSEQERIKEVKKQLNRTFQGQFKFAPGAFIATIGSRCGQCPVCRPDVATGDTDQEEATSSNQFHKDTQTAWNHMGYFQVTDNGKRRLTSFTFWPTTEVRDLEPTTLPDGSIGWKQSQRRELMGDLIDDEGQVFREIRIPEKAWGSKRELISAIKGYGDALVYCGDADTQKLLKSVVSFARMKAQDKELEKMTRSIVCGIFFDRVNGKTVPHYVEADGSITSNGMRSAFRFHGNPRQSPTLLNGQDPLPGGDTELEIAISSLCQINEPIACAKALGWFVAAHFRQHIQFREPQFPILNINGNAEAGKTSMAMAMALINGIDYSVSEYMNVEVGSDYPLRKFVSSSTTVPRLIEEVNPLQLGTRYPKIVALLKAGWNSSPVQRGMINSDKELGTTEDRVSAPLVYTSEQSATTPSLRGRSVEVMLQSRTLTDPNRQRHYKQVIERKESLYRIARALVTVAMDTSPAKLLEVFHAQDKYINPEISARPRWGHKTCLTGLKMLIHTMESFDVGGVQEVQKLYDTLVHYLGGKVVEAERGRSTSEVDRVLTTLNHMADPSSEERYRLMPGVHYWRAGDSVFLSLGACMQRYKLYSRAMGEQVTISAFEQLHNLITGEIYFQRTEPYPGRESTNVYVVSASALEKRGTSMANFVESQVSEEA